MATTHDDLMKMNMDEIAKHFGVKRPKPGVTKRQFIDDAIAATTAPVTLDGETTTVKLGKVSVGEGATMPRIELRAVDKGISMFFTPLGKGRWRVETTADKGVGEVDGGIDATWDLTTLVLANIFQDQMSHFTWFDPLVAPVIEEGDDADDS